MTAEQTRTTARSFRPSGADWPPEVPAEWAVAPLRARYSVELGKMLDEKTITGHQLLPYLRNVDVQWDRVNTRGLPEMDIGPGEYERYTLKEGDLLVCEGGEVGRAAFWHGEFAACGYQKALHRLRPLLPGNEVPRFLFWLLRAAVSEGIFEAGSNPNTILHLTGAMLRARRLPFPDASEQRAIVDFLDRKASEIDALVAKKERLIELLQEKRSALVTQAVTKGLDPAAPMKDSGIPWLGELPAHWKIARMGDVFRTLSGGTPDRSMDRFWDGDIPWVSPKDMKRPEITDAEESISVAALRECGLKLIAPGAILVVVRGMILAHSFPVAVTAVPVTINQDMKALVVPPSISCQFAALWLRGTSSVIRGMTVEDAAHGTKAIRQDMWRTLPFPILPIEEQNAIVSSVEEQNTHIDALSGKVIEAIDRLREYRTALVSAAVTGKINVGHDRVRPGAADAV